jgi:O-6-methylguanine DNA methyltransferase
MTFKDSVYEITKKIPKGKVATYKQIAILAGNPKAARAVGLCMKTNPNPLDIPCHRVIASNGSMVGYSLENGISTKKEKLLSEGVQFKGEKVDLKTSQWCQ